jgi:hypothetical protein
MDLRIRGGTRPDPFLGAADLLSTEHDLDRTVEVQVRDDPDERTWAAHYDDRHVLNISEQAATSAMARELALHELAHMARYEQGHASHTQSTDEALFLALSGRDVERRKLTHCYQIANHMRDIYADDITLSVAPAAKLVQFLESQLATAVAAAPGPEATRHPDGRRVSVAADPDITAVNAAFALGLVERHGLIDGDHRLYDLARAAAADAPGVGMETFKRLFRTLADDPTESDFRRDLVTATRAYALDGENGRAAD